MIGINDVNQEKAEKAGFYPQKDEKFNDMEANIPQNGMFQNNQEENLAQSVPQYPVEIKQDNNCVQTEVDQQIKISIRIGFIRKVFSIITLQLIITFSFVLFCQLNFMKRFFMSNPGLASAIIIICSVSFLVLYFSILCCRNMARKVPGNYIALFGITICESFLCGAITFELPFQVVLLSLLLTILSSGIITAYACRTKSDFSRLRIILSIVLGQFLVFCLFSLFVRTKFTTLMYSLFSSLIIAFYLVYDIQLIIGKFEVSYSIDDYIFAALEVYMDIIRLFIEILKIVSRFSSRNN